MKKLEKIEKPLVFQFFAGMRWWSRLLCAALSLLCDCFEAALQVLRDCLSLLCDCFETALTALRCPEAAWRLR